MTSCPLPSRLRRLCALAVLGAGVAAISSCGNTHEAPAGPTGELGVAATANPQVALYTWIPPGTGVVHVDFGPTTAYGRATSTVETSGDRPVSIYVAGMLANTTYHMRASLVTSAGATLSDADRTFTTTSWPANQLPVFTAAATSGSVPQPGVDLIDVSNTNFNQDLPLYVSDLNGNLLWAYPLGQGTPLTILQGARLLPNGHFLIEESFGSQDLLNVPPPTGQIDLIREIDLAGNTIRELSASDLNSRLAAGGFTGINIQDLHHEITVLPNGHILLLGAIFKTISGLTGQATPVNVLGDVVVDLDANWNPTWVWNEFDHLDPNRQFVSFPDWTHSNAILYSPDDGNLIVSSRDQSWLIKVDYHYGGGAGDVLWRLGYQGDFTLTNGNSPQDWFYGQHDPNFVSRNTTGTFQLTLVDDGFGRLDSAGNQCTALVGSSICYTTIPILTINEEARTATITWRYLLPTAQYTYWGGSTEPLANGDLEFTLSNQPNNTSTTYEVTSDASQRIVWQLQVTNQSIYRDLRIPSLYPGVQW
jgi:arylsulfate sulfotransferase